MEWADELLWVLIAGGAVVAGVTAMRRGSPTRRRQRWITRQLAAEEARAPGGRFSDDEYLLRLEDLERRWDEGEGGD